ncbi:AtpZ/AtpI family protein [Halanaerobaculum tunisiense]
MKDNLSVLQALALLSQVGIAIIVPTFGGLWVGNYLDQLLGIEPLLLAVGIITGVVVGFRNAYRLLMSKQDERKSD